MARLPIDDAWPDIAAALDRSLNVVVTAPTGSGKTTRLPNLLLDHLAPTRDIVVVEPRRLAARMVATWLAQSRREPVGSTIGYEVRFDRKVSDATRVRFVTAGLFARQLLGDPMLSRTQVVILDEVHERHLDSDLVLAWCRRLQTTERRDLRIVAMSATTDADTLACFLGDCAVIRAAGRQYDVTVSYAAMPDKRPLSIQVAGAVRRLAKGSAGNGSILVFLPGAAEIRQCSTSCIDVSRAFGLDLVPLHGDLTPAQQDRAVGGDRPRLILSTNIAESAITIDGVSGVVDSGLARKASYSPWSGTRMLTLQPIAQASAIQRTGRAGRTQAGHCERLYTKHDFETRRRDEPPEIAHADLATLVLHLGALGIADAREFSWWQEPDGDRLNAATGLLRQLGAIDCEGTLTGPGRAMARLAVHPRHARMILEAERRGVGQQACMLAAIAEDGRTLGALLRDQPSDTDSSDLLKAATALEVAPAARARLVRKAGAQLRRRVGRDAAGLTRMEEQHRLLISILAGYPDRVAKRRHANKADVVFAGGGAGRLADTSCVREDGWLVAIDAEERGRGAQARTLVRCASAIEPEWLIDLFENEVEDIDELAWDAKQEIVVRVSQLRYGALALEDSRQPHDARTRSDEASRILATAACNAGIEAFVDAEHWRELTARLAFAATVDSKFAPFTDSEIEQLIVTACIGATSFAELRSALDARSLRAQFGPRWAQLEQIAPVAVSLPGRRRVKVHYAADRSPWIESRLQDFFGLKEGPRVGQGAVPLVLHLLAPNRRAVQVTTDLTGFWDRHYPEIRRQLMRRYPKHSWPENPVSS